MKNKSKLSKKARLNNNDNNKKIEIAYYHCELLLTIVV